LQGFGQVGFGKVILQGHCGTVIDDKIEFCICTGSHSLTIRGLQALLQGGHIRGTQANARGGSFQCSSAIHLIVVTKTVVSGLAGFDAVRGICFGVVLHGNFAVCRHGCTRRVIDNNAERSCPLRVRRPFNGFLTVPVIPIKANVLAVLYFNVLRVDYLCLKCTIILTDAGLYGECIALCQAHLVFTAAHIVVLEGVMISLLRQVIDKHQFGQGLRGGIDRIVHCQGIMDAGILIRQDGRGICLVGAGRVNCMICRVLLGDGNRRAGRVTVGHHYIRTAADGCAGLALAPIRGGQFFIDHAPGSRTIPAQVVPQRGQPGGVGVGLVDQPRIIRLFGPKPKICIGSALNCPCGTSQPYIHAEFSRYRIPNNRNVERRIFFYNRVTTIGSAMCICLYFYWIAIYFEPLVRHQECVTCFVIIPDRAQKRICITTF